MSSRDVACTATQVRLLRPIDEMALPVRRALTRWLWDHEITPSSVVVGLAIERDETNHVLVWREQQPDGSVLKRWRYAAVESDRTWPARFPDVLVAPAAGADVETISREA